MTMVYHTQVAPAKVTAKILAFCAQLCPGQKPAFLPVTPAAGAQLLECYGNVAAKVAKDGGRAVLGWSLSEILNVYLEAEFHCIWESPAHLRIDVTPLHFQHPRILFLEDRVRAYAGTQVPNQRFALADQALVDKFWFLSDLAAAKLRGLVSQGFPRGHPAYKDLLPLHAQLEALREQARTGP
jgi:hypothetical protein